MSTLLVNQKPDWKDAPEWAKFLCKDHGDWYWVEHIPDNDGGISGKFKVAAAYNTGVSEAPEARPE